MKIICFLFLVINIIACNSPKKPLSKAEQVNLDNSNAIENCKTQLQRGDLILRLGDDMISQILADLSPSENKYSHCGIVEKVGDKFFVYNIYPESVPGIKDDTIRLEPVDSFINPNKNKNYALFRYTLSPTEMDSFFLKIKEFQKKQARFDFKFNIKDDDKLYCSELIVKSLESVTKNRIQFPRVIVDSTRVIGVKRFFNIMDNSIDLKKYPILTLDNLYLNGRATKVCSGNFRKEKDFK